MKRSGTNAPKLKWSCVMSTNNSNKYLEYEREKARLLEECTTVQEYQIKIAELCRRLKI